jgi:hypothetical protein
MRTRPVPPDTATDPAPLGPDSLTWKYFGDLRTGMLGVWIGAIQNMYPQLGAGVEDHSILLREPLQRVARSVYPIMGVVYDGDRAAQTGAQIKGFHTTIKGVDAKGQRYHARAGVLGGAGRDPAASAGAGRLPPRLRPDAADAPLVEAPFFTDPPKDRKGMPMHYAPRRKLPFPMAPVPTPPIPKALAERPGSLVHTTFSLAGRRPARGRRRPAA